MDEVLKAVRIIKFFGLEDAFLGRIREKRETELNYYLTTRVYSLMFYCVTSLLPVMNMVSDMLGKRDLLILTNGM